MFSFDARTRIHTQICVQNYRPDIPTLAICSILTNYNRKDINLQIMSLKGANGKEVTRLGPGAHVPHIVLHL